MRGLRLPALAFAVVLALAGLTTFLVLRSSAETPGSAPANTREFLRMMDARYAPLETAAPSETRGTGFKPYHRYKWFVENRLDAATSDEIPGARWQAWEQMTRLEQQYGTRSETWFSLGPINVAGRCLAIAVHPTDPNTAYAGFASSGLWKTTDGGTTWTPLGDNLPTLAIGCIKIDPENPDRMWMGTGEGWGNTDAIHGVGLLASTDAGATWNQTGYSYGMNTGRDVFAIDYNPATGTLVLGADNGLWRSTDGGATFTQLYTLGQWKDVKMKPGSTSVWYACSHQGPEFGFFRSTDDGATWTNQTNGTPTTGVNNNRFAVTPANPELILWGIAKTDGSMLGLWKSTNGGDSFTQVNTGNPNQYGGQGWYDLTISIDPQDANKVFGGGVDFYHSFDGGSTFQIYAAYVHVDHHAVAWSPSNPTQFWIGSDGGVWRSNDSGATFQDRNSGLTTLQFYAVNQSDTMPTRALGGTQDNGTYLYNNNLNWTYILGGDGFFTEVDRLRPDTLYAEIYYGNHHRSVNGGATMLPKNSGIGEQGPWSTPTHMDYANPAIIWTAHNTKIYRTTNSMGSWTFMNNPTGLGGGRSINQCRAFPNNVVVIGGSKVWLTTDNGSTWNDRTSGMITQNTMSDVAVDPNDPNIMVVTCQTYSATIPQVRRTTDQGLTWTAIDAGLPDEPANTIEIDPQHPTWYFIGTDLGVYISFDSGANWQPFNTGLPHVVVSDLRIQNTARVLRAGTHGRGMWEVDISGLGPTSVEPHPTVQAITLRVLGNPASDHTVLRYGIRSPGQVRLGLYDLQGRLVRSLVDRFEYPILNSIDVDLRGLPSGVYFARLQANGTEASQKVTVRR